MKIYTKPLSVLLLGVLSMPVWAALEVPPSSNAAHPLQFLHLPDLSAAWQIDYHRNEDTWAFKNTDMKPKQGSYATAMLYLSPLNDALPRQADAFAKAITESGALTSGIRFAQVDKIQKVANGFVVYGQEQSELDPSGTAYPSFVMVRHLAGANVVCHQGDASGLADPQELVQTGVALCQKLTR